MTIFGSIWSGVKSVVGTGLKVAGQATGILPQSPTVVLRTEPAPAIAPSASPTIGPTAGAQSQSALDALTARLETIAGRIGAAAAQPIGAAVGEPAGKAGATKLIPWIVGGVAVISVAIIAAVTLGGQK